MTKRGAHNAASYTSITQSNLSKIIYDYDSCLYILLSLATFFMLTEVGICKTVTCKHTNTMLKLVQKY